MRGTRLRRTGTALAAGAAALFVLAACSAADRAVLTAPSCAAGTAAPATSAPTPGTVYAWRPHFAAQNVPGRSAPPPPPPVGPQPVPGWTDVVSIAGSGHTTFAVKTDGTVWAYGLGHHGLLGDGDPERHAVDVPQQVAGIAGARSVHVVGSAAFAVLRDGTVMGWGDGLLAHAGRTGSVGQHVATPIPIPGLEGVVSIADGELTAIALQAGGTVTGWGTNVTDVLGDHDGTSATTIDDVEGVVGVASAGGAVIAVTGRGSVCAWGNNAHGLLGVEPRGGQTGRPVTVDGLSGIVQVAGGHDLAYALDATGTVRAWGRGVHGALGDGDSSDHVSTVPTVVTGVPPARWIGATGFTGFAVDTDGRLWAWGSALPLGGHAPPEGAARPVHIPLPGPVLSASGMHALVRPPAAGPPPP
jgi:regulator of chromosome condensation